MAIATFVSALVVAGIGFALDDTGLAICSFVVGASFAIILAYGGWTGRFQDLRGESDERELDHQHEAQRIAGTAVLLGVIVYWIRNLSRGDYLGWPQTLMATWATAYGATLLWDVGCGMWDVRAENGECSYTTCPTSHIPRPTPPSQPSQHVHTLFTIPD